MPSRRLRPSHDGSVDAIQTPALTMFWTPLLGVAGYISGVQYKLFGGTNWVRNVLLTATLFCGPLLVVFSFLNTVAIVYRVRRGKPVSS